ncbi:MAG: mercury methylation corrinoid protein HgcA [Thermodesulfobacteriota bacterium]
MQPLDLPKAPARRQDAATCCGASSAPLSSRHPDDALPPPWVVGEQQTPLGQVPRISTVLTRADWLGAIRSRISAFRMAYRVSAGLYAVGSPGANAEVFVSANYKLSFDELRRHLAGLDAWVLVLDTRGINVWCAAGKGTFGTEELVRRVQATGLAGLVSHRRLILPQLAAPGVKAREVKARTGFIAQFGPVRAADIPAYLAAGCRKTPAMATVHFPWRDRLVLTPMEILPAMKLFPLYGLAVLLVFGLQPQGILFAAAWSGGWPFLLLGAATIGAGAFLAPMLLPLLPFRSFAVKGWLAGLATAVATGTLLGERLTPHPALSVVVYLLYPLLASYITLQFTGSTTFTHMSGVKKELRYALPVYLGGAALSALLLGTFKLAEWGIWSS